MMKVINSKGVRWRLLWRDFSKV